MRHTSGLLAAALIACVFLPACHTAKAPATAAPPAPFIAGDWSQPVNGVRMGVRPIVYSSTGEDVWLLILVENTTSREVDWPGIIAEPDVQFFGLPPTGSSLSGANLRIVAEPLDGQPIAEASLLQLSGMMRQMDPLAAGEIRLHAIRLHDDQLQQQMMQQAPNQVESESVYWSGLAGETAVGRWRLHLTYRPEGFPPPPGDESLYEDIEFEVRGWEEMQIDLPPVEVEVWPSAGSQHR